MYYTPRLEEFHLGFECEILVDEKWQLCTLGYRKSRAAQLKGLIHAKTHGYSNTVTIDEDFRMSNLRVKWLEAHDIVDFGFSFTSEDADCQHFMGGDCTIELVKATRKLRIRHEGEVIFYGMIRNRSELRKIFQKTGIAYVEQERPLVYVGMARELAS